MGMSDYCDIEMYFFVFDWLVNNALLESMYWL